MAEETISKIIKEDIEKPLRDAYNYWNANKNKFHASTAVAVELKRRFEIINRVAKTIIGDTNSYSNQCDSIINSIPNNSDSFPFISKINSKFSNFTCAFNFGVCIRFGEGGGHMMGILKRYLNDPYAPGFDEVASIDTIFASFYGSNPIDNLVIIKNNFNILIKYLQDNQRSIIGEAITKLIHLLGDPLSVN